MSDISQPAMEAPPAIKKIPFTTYNAGWGISRTGTG